MDNFNGLAQAITEKELLHFYMHVACWFDNTLTVAGI